MVLEEAPAVPLSGHYIDEPGGPSCSPADSPAEQALLALTLITTWALATGRTLRSDVPPSQLTEDELIDFWADPLTGTREPCVSEQVVQTPTRSPVSSRSSKASNTSLTDALSRASHGRSGT